MRTVGNKNLLSQPSFQLHTSLFLKTKIPVMFFSDFVKSGLQNFIELFSRSTFLYNSYNVSLKIFLSYLQLHLDSVCTFIILEVNLSLLIYL